MSEVPIYPKHTTVGVATCMARSYRQAANGDVSDMLLFLLSLAICCYSCCRWRYVVIPVVVGDMLLFLLSLAICCYSCCRCILNY